LFYPRDPVRLQTEVLELLGEIASASKVIPKALIAPHAGYVYSGRVAGAAFAKIRASAQTITRVVLIGPAHYVFPRRGLDFWQPRYTRLHVQDAH
jgi:MEMO1 family protein